MMRGSLDVAGMMKKFTQQSSCVVSQGHPVFAAWSRVLRLRIVPRRAPLVLGALALATMACDGSVPTIDASSSPPSARASAISLRIDVPAEKPPLLSVLAFRAAFSGVPASDVLGIVDPLAAAAPAQDCQLRDVDRAVAALVAQGQAIELEELTGVGISLGEGSPDIRPSPRLYPDVAATVGGVVAEAGPLGLAAVPQRLRVTNGSAGVLPNGSQDAAAVGVPAAGWVTLLNGAVPHEGSRIEVAADLNLRLAIGDGAATSVELRPLGTTVALSCVVPAGVTPAGGEIMLTVSRQFLTALVSTLGGTPGTPVAAALDLVRRANERLPLSDTRVSVEVRTSTVVELRR